MGGFWKRLFAFFIDGFIIYIPFAVLSYLIYGTFNYDEQTVFNLTSGLVGTLYFIIAPVTSLQATLGKAALGMKITDRAGRKISLARSIGRYFAQILSYLTFFFGYLMIGFTKEKTGLHDLIAGTYVVNKQ